MARCIRAGIRYIGPAHRSSVVADMVTSNRGDTVGHVRTVSIIGSRRTRHAVGRSWKSRLLIRASHIIVVADRADGKTGIITNVHSIVHSIARCEALASSTRHVIGIARSVKSKIDVRLIELDRRGIAHVVIHGWLDLCHTLGVARGL